ncbi:MAG: hypothetical protein ACTSPE_01595 [Candidatus Thorarchaeota archaeon]
MSLLGKYRKEAGKESETKVRAESVEPQVTTVRMPKVKRSDSVPNKERKSPIVSFSIASDLRACLQAIRKTKAINLSMWVEKQLRQAVIEEFPNIAKQYLQ